MFSLFVGRRLGGVSRRLPAVYCFFPRPPGSHHSRGTRWECKYQATLFSRFTQSCINTDDGGSWRRLCVWHTRRRFTAARGRLTPCTAIPSILKGGLRCDSNYCTSSDRLFFYSGTTKEAWRSSSFHPNAYFPAFTSTNWSLFYILIINTYWPSHPNVFLRHNVVITRFVYDNNLTSCLSETKSVSWYLVSP